jgi:hypothetical protein
MEIDPTLTMGNALTAGSYAVALCVAVYTWFVTRRSDVDQRFKAGSKRMADLELRVQAAEQELATVPDKDSFHRLELMLAEMGGDLKAMRANTRAIADSQDRLENIVGRHEDHLRNQS